jgi:hypothetical protein
MSECKCVYATAENTASVRSGFEAGGYLKEECEACQGEEVHPTCKHCGSQDIHGYDTIVATAVISHFNLKEDGTLEPEWEGSTDVIWDTQKPYDASKPFFCEGCSKLLSIEDLVVPAAA